MFSIRVEHVCKSVTVIKNQQLLLQTASEENSGVSVEEHLRQRRLSNLKGSVKTCLKPKTNQISLNTNIWLGYNTSTWRLTHLSGGNKNHLGKFVRLNVPVKQQKSDDTGVPYLEQCIMGYIECTIVHALYTKWRSPYRCRGGCWYRIFHLLKTCLRIKAAFGSLQGCRYTGGPPGALVSRWPRPLVQQHINRKFSGIQRDLEDVPAASGGTSAGQMLLFKSLKAFQPDI